jgi:DNA-binding MarR family transcriptional regulator
MSMSSSQARNSGGNAKRAAFAAVDLMELPIARSRGSANMQLAGGAEQKLAPQSDLVPALLAISKSMRALRGIRLAELGFANGQDELLMAIPPSGLAVNEIADALMIRPSTVSKMGDRLVDKGLMERAPDPKDKRLTIMKLTSAGFGAREQVTAAQADLELELAKTMDEATLEAQQACLKDCAEMLKGRLRRLR